MLYNKLQHTGVKGMKWGVRRYQNKDGSLTNAGKKRYERNQRENSGKKKGNKVGVADPNRWVREDMERSKRLADSGHQTVNALKNANQNAINRSARKRTKIDLSSMTDQQLRDKINRANLERQYNDIYNPARVSKGRAYASDVLEYGGAALAVTASVLDVALAIKELKG